MNQSEILGLVLTEGYAKVECTVDTPELSNSKTFSEFMNFRHDVIISGLNVCQKEFEYRYQKTNWRD